MKDRRLKTILDKYCECKAQAQRNIAAIAMIAGRQLHS